MGWESILLPFIMLLICMAKYHRVCDPNLGHPVLSFAFQLTPQVKLTLQPLMTSVLVNQLWLHVIGWCTPVDRGRWGGIGTKCHAHSGCLAGCRKALVGTGWTICLLSSTNWCRNHSSSFVEAQFLY